MKRKRLTGIIVITFLLIIIQNRVVAQDEITTETYQDTAPITEVIDDLIDQDLEGAAQNILADFLDGIPFLNNLKNQIEGIRQEVLNFKIPSTERIKVIVNQNIEDLSTSTERLENSPDNPSIVKEIEDKVIRATFEDVIEETSLGTQGQQRLAEVAELVQKTVEDNIDLGEESQTLDVSQQILQNISKQNALSASNQSILITQNQQAQVDRAMGNLLQAQTAEELAKINAKARRETAGSNDLLQRQWGLVRIPGAE